MRTYNFFNWVSNTGVELSSVKSNDTTEKYFQHITNIYICTVRVKIKIAFFFGLEAAESAKRGEQQDVRPLYLDAQATTPLVRDNYYSGDPL